MKISKEEMDSVLDWISKVYKFFTPYKPETRKMFVNYRNHSSEISLFVQIPSGPKRKLGKIKIPSYQNFTITNMIDESFNPVTDVWINSDGYWIMDASKLPKSEKYLITMAGTIPDSIINKIVRVQPAKNKDSTTEIDRYWLDSMIRDADILEDMWEALNIDEVNTGVKIGIERFFTSTIPTDFNKKLEVTQKFMSAGFGKDRNELFKAWGKMRQSEKSSDINIKDILDAINKLTSNNFFNNYVNADEPYKIGEITPEKIVKGIYPEKMGVEARTTLNLKCPVATGYLNFDKLKYENDMKRMFDILKGGKKVEENKEEPDD